MCRLLIPIIFLFPFLIVVLGCDTDSDKSVTGSFFYRKTGELKSIGVSPDSITIASTFRENMGSSSYALTGRYKNIEAFSVFLFSVQYVSTDNLLGASVKFNINDIWKDGTIDFDLFETHSEWSDTTSLDSESFLGNLGTPVATVSDLSDTLKTFTFDVDPDIIMSWSTQGSFLIKSSESGMSMLNLFTDDTNYPPVLKLIRKTGTGSVDTTNVQSSTGTYYIQTGTGEGDPVLSEGAASGFVLNLNIPESIPSMAAINRCIIKMEASNSVIPDAPLYVGIYKLKSEFTTLAEAGIVESERIPLQIYTDETLEIDITSYVSAWLHIKEEHNYGLLVKPSESTVSPNQCVFIPVDSLIITYTELPEVE